MNKIFPSGAGVKKCYKDSFQINGFESLVLTKKYSYLILEICISNF